MAITRADIAEAKSQGFEDGVRLALEVLEAMVTTESWPSTRQALCNAIHLIESRRARARRAAADAAKKAGK